MLPPNTGSLLSIVEQRSVNNADIFNMLLIWKLETIKFLKLLLKFNIYAKTDCGTLFIPKTEIHSAQYSWEVNKKIEEEKAKSTVGFTFDEIAMKIDTALRYFSSLDNYRKASKMVIAGGSSIKGLASFLSDRFSLDAVPLNPFKAVKVDARVAQETDLTATAGIYSVAVGLALRRF